jgi:hypothetical protein
MKFRVIHLLAAMAFVAIWLPLSRWLLALEARDHPQKPQEWYDVVAFYLGSTVLAIIPIVAAWIAVAWWGRRRRDRSRPFEQR